MFAVGAAFAALASAETTLLAEWLVNGVGVGTLTAAIVTGEFILGDKGVKARVKCNYTLDGSIGPNGEAEETEGLTLEGAVITKAAPLLCKSLTGSSCEENATDIEASPAGFPWHVLGFLDSNGAYLESIKGETWLVTCLDLGLKISDECTFPETTFGLKNVSGGIEIIGLSTPLGNCTLGGKETGEIEAGTGDGDDSTMGSLAISSE
jgi:hypothetical protein